MGWKITEKLLKSLFCLMLILLTVLPQSYQVFAFSADAQRYIDYYGIPTTNAQGKTLNENILLSADHFVVYGTPFGDQKQGQYRYLGYDLSGNKFSNPKFPPDLDVTKSVAKNWIKEPWLQAVGQEKKIKIPQYNRVDASKWLSNMLDPYNPPNGNWLTSYNKIKGTTWTGDTLYDYAVIQTPPTEFGQGLVVIWNQASNGKWWYQDFLIPPLKKITPIPAETIDLEITSIQSPSKTFINTPIQITVTVKNNGTKASGSFEVGVTGLTNKAVTNVSPKQQVTVTFTDVKFTTVGVKNLTAMADAKNTVVESNEGNNSKNVQVTVDKQPTTPVAVIGHKEGNTLSDQYIIVEPSETLNLTNQSYDPNGEPLTYEGWTWENDTGMIQPWKPIQFSEEKTYTVKLYVKNSSGKSGETTLTIVVQKNPPISSPMPELTANAEFQPKKILIGEQASLRDLSEGETSRTWEFSLNLSSVSAGFRDKTKSSYGPYTFNQAGTYSAKVFASDSLGNVAESPVTYLEVIDPKPIAVLNGVNRIIQGRSFPVPYDLSGSYSPMNYMGVTVNHELDQYRWKLNTASSYQTGLPSQAPAQAGTYYIEGQVKDSSSRTSDWVRIVLEVIPDQAPTVTLQVTNQILRDQNTLLYIDANSPDYDPLNRLVLQERYDDNNDGVYTDEPWVTLYDGVFKTTHTVSYSAVGKWQYRATVYESFGKSGYGESVLDVINQSPTVNFNTWGDTPQPAQDSNSDVPTRWEDVNSIYGGWKLSKGQLNHWKVENGFLATVEGRFIEPSLYEQRIDFNTQSLVQKQRGKGLNGIFAYPIQITGSSLSSATIDFTQIPSYPVPAWTSGYYSWYVNDVGTKLLGVWYDGTLVIRKQYLYRGKNTKSSSYYDIGYVDVLAGYNRNGMKLWDTVSTGYNNLDAMDINEEPLTNQNSFLGPSTLVGMNKQSGLMYFTFKNSFSGLSAYSYLYALNPKTGIVQKMIRLDVQGYYGTFKGMMSNQEFITSVRIGSNPSTYYVDKHDLNLNQTVDNKAIGGDTDGELIQGFKLINGDYYLTMQVTHPFVYRYDSNFNQIPTNQYILAYPGNPYVFENSNRYYGVTEEEPFGSDVIAPAFKKVDLANNQDLGTTYLTFIPINSPTAGNKYSRTEMKFVGADEKFYVLGTTDTNEFLYRYNDTLFKVDQAGTIIGTFDWKENIAKFTDSSNVVSYQKATDQYGATVIELTSENELVVSDPVSMSNGVVQGRVIALDLNTMSIKWEVPFQSTQDKLPFVAIPNGGLVTLSGNNIYSLSQSGSSSYIEVNDSSQLNNLGGLWYKDKDNTKKDYVITTSIQTNTSSTGTVGLGVRIQDENNLYQLEWSSSQLSWVKIQEGVRTVLGTVNLNRIPYQSYSLKASVIGSQLIASVDGIQRLSVSDSTFSSGAYGIFSFGQSKLSFNGLSVYLPPTMTISPTYDAVLVGEKLNYETIFQDPENDPMGWQEWTYQHYPNFFENADSLSSLHGKTFNTPVSPLDRAGAYDISFRAGDDPTNGNSLFDGYRKFSDMVTKRIFAHRRPVSQPQVQLTGKVYDLGGGVKGELIDYDSLDQSYDPDLDNGISEKKFRTRWADQCQTCWTDGKKDYYDRENVWLIIQEMVKDKMGAWSFWGETAIYQEVLPAINQHKPAMGITYPNGTLSSPTALRREPTIQWAYDDSDGDVQEGYQLELTYVDTGETALYLDLPGNDLSYALVNESLENGRKIKVRGKVQSNGVWSDWSNEVYFYMNIPSKTQLLNLNGPDNTQPVYTKDNTPELQVSVLDSEGNYISYIHYSVYDANTGVQLLNDASSNNTKFTMTSVLPDGLYYWKARAYDGEWGDYSSIGYFYVDTRPPTATSNTIPTTTSYQAGSFDTLVHGVNDNGGSGVSAIKFLVWTDAGGQDDARWYNGTDGGNGTWKISIPFSNHKYEKGLYHVQVFSYDIVGNSGKIYDKNVEVIQNQPPTAEFTWTPSTIWVGDRVNVKSQSVDPDGDALTYHYTLTHNGINTEYSTKDISFVVTEAGDYSLTHTVTDPSGSFAQITHPFQVKNNDLSFTVNHSKEIGNTGVSWEQMNEGRLQEEFFAGEPFVVNATASSNATKLEMRLEFPIQGLTPTSWVNLANQGNGNWVKEYFDPQWTNPTYAYYLKKDFGNIVVKVRATYDSTYSDSLKQKEVGASITIKGSVFDQVKMHRKY